jgi:hypothetical protein
MVAIRVVGNVRILRDDMLGQMGAKIAALSSLKGVLVVERR